MIIAYTAEHYHAAFAAAATDAIRFRVLEDLAGTLENLGMFLRAEYKRVGNSPRFQSAAHLFDSLTNAETMLADFMVERITDGDDDGDIFDNGTRIEFDAIALADRIHVVEWRHDEANDW